VPSRAAPTKKRGNDGLTERESAFVRERRADPAAPLHVIAERAGYKGNAQVLAQRARDLMKKPVVSRAVFAPRPADEDVPEIDNEKLKRRIRHELHQILLNERTTTADKIKAADKLLATVPGGFVPLQVNQTGTLTLEGWVRAMGGGPAEDHQMNGHALPPAAQEET
jgi:hypothetical protein